MASSVKCSTWYLGSCKFLMKEGKEIQNTAGNAYVCLMVGDQHIELNCITFLKDFISLKN